MCISRFSEYAKYNTQNKQVLMGLVGQRFFERYIHQPSSASCLVSYAYYFSSSGFDVHTRSFDFVLCYVSMCILPPVPALWALARTEVSSNKWLAWR